VQTTLISQDGTVVKGSGTSFATPLLAGMAATLWSALPNENAMQMRERIIRSADRYANPDTKRYGYGIPNAWMAYQMDIDEGITPAHTSPGNTRKILQGYQIIILRGDRTYDLLGREL
jgi:subtilase family serine protease